MSEYSFGAGLGTVISVVAVVAVLGGMYGCPQYNVYSERLSGQAALAKSQAERQVQIQDAESKKAAATMLAEAEVIRAEGAAKANDVLMQKLGGPEGYLRYLFIQTLENRKGDTIYIPTEANLPILEANRKLKQ